MPARKLGLFAKASGSEVFVSDSARARAAGIFESSHLTAAAALPPAPASLLSVPVSVDVGRDSTVEEWKRPRLENGVAARTVIATDNASIGAGVSLLFDDGACGGASTSTGVLVPALAVSVDVHAHSNGSGNGCVSGLFKKASGSTVLVSDVAWSRAAHIFDCSDKNKDKDTDININTVTDKNKNKNKTKNSVIDVGVLGAHLGSIGGVAPTLQASYHYHRDGSSSSLSVAGAVTVTAGSGALGGKDVLSEKVRLITTSVNNCVNVCATGAVW